MKYLLILFLSIISFSASLAQEIFNRNYSFPNNVAMTSLVSVEDGFVGLGAAWFDSKQFIMINKFDFNGEIIDTIYYGDTIYHWYHGAENNLIHVKDGGYALSGNKTSYTPNDRYLTLFRFNEAFDTLWSKEYLQDTVDIIAYATTYCSDGGFAIAGWSMRDVENGEVLSKTKAFLVRTDSLGNLLWTKTFGTDDYKDAFDKVVQTPDGGFLCGGATKSYSSNHNWDWFLVKTDSLGNEEWNRTYGNINYVDSRICGITMTKDSSYIITGSIAHNSDYQKPYIVKLDQDFETELTKTLPYMASSSVLFQVRELDNHQFIAVGSDRLNIYNLRQTNLTKFDADFNEIWHRRYTVGDTTETENYINSVDLCSDGGYILGGWATHMGQKLALIKTDEYGCDGTDWWDCSTGVMIKEYANSESFKLYPNPTNSYAVVESSKLKVTSVEIYDLTGKLVKGMSSYEATNSFKFDVSELESGIYMVKIGERIEKLVVE